MSAEPFSVGLHNFALLKMVPIFRFSVILQEVFLFHEEDIFIQKMRVLFLCREPPIDDKGIALRGVDLPLLTAEDPFEVSN